LNEKKKLYSIDRTIILTYKTTPEEWETILKELHPAFSTTKSTKMVRLNREEAIMPLVDKKVQQRMASRKGTSCGRRASMNCIEKGRSIRDL